MSEKWGEITLSDYMTATANLCLWEIYQQMKVLTERWAWIIPILGITWYFWHLSCIHFFFSVQRFQSAPVEQGASKALTSLYDISGHLFYIFFLWYQQTTALYEQKVNISGSIHISFPEEPYVKSNITSHMLLKTSRDIIDFIGVLWMWWSL